ncbi:MAG: hypothetical protein ACOC42_02785 [Halobacteriota archaeon]
MRWSRPIGLLGTALVVVIFLGALAQLAISIFAHGGVIPALVIVTAFVTIVGRIGARDHRWLANPYW